RIVVDYDAMIENPTQQLERIAGAMRLPVAAGSERAMAEFASGFLSSSLPHSVHDTAAPREDPRAVASVATGYGMAQTLSRTARLATARAQAMAKEWSAIGDSLNRVAPMLHYLDACETRIDALVREADTSLRAPAEAPVTAKAVTAPRKRKTSPTAEAR